MSALDLELFVKAPVLMESPAADPRDCCVASALLCSFPQWCPDLPSATYVLLLFLLLTITILFPRLASW